MVKELVPDSIWGAEIKAAAKLLELEPKVIKSYFAANIRRLDENKISEFDFWNNLCKENNLKCPSFSKLKLIFRIRQVRFKPSLAKIVVGLKKRGIKVGIISGAIKPHAKMIRRAGVYKYFSPVVLSCNVGLSKTDPRIFKIAAKKTEVRFDEIIFFDDKLKNVKIARSLGIYAYLFKNPRQVAKILEKYGLL